MFGFQLDNGILDFLNGVTQFLECLTKATALCSLERNRSNPMSDGHRINSGLQDA